MDYFFHTLMIGKNHRRKKTANPCEWRFLTLGELFRSSGSGSSGGLGKTGRGEEGGEGEGGDVLHGITPYAYPVPKPLTVPLAQEIDLKRLFFGKAKEVCLFLRLERCRKLGSSRLIDGDVLLGGFCPAEILFHGLLA